MGRQLADRYTAWEPIVADAWWLDITGIFRVDYSAEEEICEATLLELRFGLDICLG